MIPLFAIGRLSVSRGHKMPCVLALFSPVAQQQFHVASRWPSTYRLSSADQTELSNHHRRVSRPPAPESSASAQAFDVWCDTTPQRCAGCILRPAPSSRSPAWSAAVPGLSKSQRELMPSLNYLNSATLHNR